MKRCYIFDIDGTIADLSHRIHFIQSKPKRYDKFYEACLDDKPIFHTIEIAATMRLIGYEIVFVTGRSEECREATEQWIRDHVFSSFKPVVYMRNKKDYRKDHLVKKDLLDRLRSDGYSPIMAFEDRSSVVKMWRENGVPCAQVAEGDF